MQPSDYPIFAFRLSTEKKESLQKRLAKILNKIQSQQENDEKLMRKNDLILSALEKGLDIIEKENKTKKG